VEHKTEIMQ